MTLLAVSGVVAQRSASTPSIAPSPMAEIDYVLADYASGALVNRGSLGTAADLVVTGPAPVVGTDTSGSFAEFDGSQFLSSAGPFDTGYSGSDFTIYTLHDGSSNTGFLFDFSRSLNRITMRHRPAQQDIGILDSSYKNYDGLVAGTLQFGTYTLNASVPEGRGYGPQQASEVGNPRDYNPRVIDTGARMGIGALATSGSSPWVGKIRALRIYFSLHDLATRQAVEADIAAEFPGAFA